MTSYNARELRNRDLMLMLAYKTSIENLNSAVPVLELLIVVLVRIENLFLGHLISVIILFPSE